MSSLDDSPSAATSPVVHPDGFRARRRINWVFLGLMYGFFYMSRYNLIAIQAAMRQLFGWSYTQYSDIAGTGVLVYGLAVFFNGPLADRIGGKRAILIGSAGAAAFNVLFGACFIFLGHAAAVTKTGVVITPALLTHGMKATTMIATFSALWACNHYFQSFGALSIVKINAAWFHVRERGSFAGIFGIMIQSGRLFAFAFSPFILRFLPWQYCFWIPAGILVVMFFVNLRFVEDSPAKVGFAFHTADETKEEEAQKWSLGFVLRKVFASPAMWIIAFSSMFIGMVRQSIDQWFSGYFTATFSLHTEDLPKFAPYNAVIWGTPIAAVLGGLVAGNLSDRVFGSRRAPVIFFAFVGMALTLGALSQGLHSAWIGAALLVLIAFFIQSAHSLVGGAASMDFGGKKAVATAAGLFDGAQYLAGAIVTYGLGRLLDAFKDAKLPGVEFEVWPLAPLPFAVLGAILIARLWNVLPGRPAVVAGAAERRRRLALVHTAQRVTLALYALVAGAPSVIAIVLPQQLAREALGHTLQPTALVLGQLYGGCQLGVAVVALVAAFTPRPPRALVRAVLLALIACVVGPIYAALTSFVPMTELNAFKKILLFDGVLALVLLATSIARESLAPPAILDEASAIDRS